MRELIVIFVTIFAAELGDKTQIATLAFASEGKSPPLLIFAASAGALVLGAALSVAAGTAAGRYVHSIPLKLVAGILFLLIGAWTVWEYFHPSAA